MSNGEKKPGVKDISDLKARLGMLNKNVGAKPAPSAAEPSPGPMPLTPDTDASLGMDTQVVRLDSPEFEPAVVAPPPLATPPPMSEAPRAVRTIPGPPAAAAPPPPVGGPLNLGADLFKKPEPEVQKAPPPASRAQAAGAQAPAVPAAPPAPSPQEKFVNPLAAIAPQTVLTDADEEALSAVEKEHKGMRPGHVVAVALVVACLAAVMGFFGGHSRIQHTLLDMQHKEAATVRDRMVPIIEKMEELANVVETMDPRTVQWKAVEAIPSDLPGVDAAGILSTKVPLPAELTSSLGKAVADLNALFLMAIEHRIITLQRDKQELEAIATGDTFTSHKLYAVRFTPPPPPRNPADAFEPPKGQVVAIVDKIERTETGVAVFPVRARNAKDNDMVPLTNLILLEKTELFESRRANVLGLYAKRVEALRAKIGQIRLYSTSLKEKLNAEAARGG